MASPEMQGSTGILIMENFEDAFEKVLLEIHCYSNESAVQSHC